MDKKSFLMGIGVGVVISVGPIGDRPTPGGEI